MRACSVCSDPRVQDIDALLAAGRSARALAIEFGFHPRVLQRHRTNHAALPVANGHAPALTEGDPLDELVASLRVQALGSANPSAAREYRLALAAQTARSAERPAYNVLADPEFLAITERLLAALEPYPDARLAAAEALRADG